MLVPPGAECDAGLLDAIETNYLEFIQEVFEVYGWQIRQLHRQEVGPTSPFDVPGVVVWEKVPAFGSPVLNLKHGFDSTSPEDEARVITEDLRRSTVTSFPAVRFKGQDNLGRFLFWERRDHPRMRELGSLNRPINGRGDGIYRKFKTGMVRNAQSLSILDDFAKVALDSFKADDWKGPITVEGASNVKPGDTVLYQNSKRGIPETEFRVLTVQFMPKQMALTISRKDPTFDKKFRSINRQLGNYEVINPLTISDLDHNFYSFTRLVDDTLVLPASTPLRARLYTDSSGSGTPVSSWADCEVITGYPINGYDSKILYALFPAEDGDGIKTPGTPPDYNASGHGTATAVLIEVPGGYSAFAELERTVFHWADNDVAICALIHHTD